MNNIVLVNQSGSKYLFSVPESIQLKEGDKVKCDTRRGITDGVCFTDSVIINTSALPLVCKLTGATLPLKEIVGKVVTSVEMFGKPVEAETPTQPIAPQEDKARFKVGDKVKIVGGFLNGDIGTITKIDEKAIREDFAPYGIQFAHDWSWKCGTNIEPYAEPEKEPEPVYFSGKVVCVKTDGDGTFTVGKVYEFVDGQVLDNKSNKRPTGMKMKSLNDEYLANWYYRFIPYLGEA